MASLFLTTVSIILFLTGASYLHAQETSFPALPEGQFRSLAEQVIQEARKVNCKPPDCLILVLDFTNVSGLTSQLGVRLADELSQDLVLQQSAIQIIDRSRLHSFLEQERIPSNLLSEQEAEHWLGKEMGATAVLEGKMTDESGSLHLKIRLLTSEKKKKGSIQEITLLV